MTNERLAQLHGNLVNLRDWTDDYRAAVLAQWAIDEIDYWRIGGVTTFAEKLATALGIAPDGAKGELK